MHFVEAKGILSSNNGMNVYRGCTHGCIYCDSRSNCYQMKHDFEDIEVKKNAPELLEAKLRLKRKRCMIGTGAMCDPYMHCESDLKITRRCLKIINNYEFGIAIQTKSDLILRDLKLLSEINHKTKAVVQMTLTTFDDDLCHILEPNVCVTSQRFEVLKQMEAENIPTVMWMTPLLPFINDTQENVKGLLDYAIKAKVKGIILWNMGVTLRDGDREYFYKALDKHFPGLKKKYQDTYGYAYEVVSSQNQKLMQIFEETCIKHKIMYKTKEIFTYLQQFPENKGYEQLSLF